MGIRQLERRATPELLARYLKQLPRIKNSREFTTVLRRARQTAAILKRDITEELTGIEVPR